MGLAGCRQRLGRQPLISAIPDQQDVKWTVSREKRRNQWILLCVGMCCKEGHSAKRCINTAGEDEEKEKTDRSTNESNTVQTRKTDLPADPASSYKNPCSSNTTPAYCRAAGRRCKDGAYWRHGGRDPKQRARKRGLHGMFIPASSVAAGLLEWFVDFWPLNRERVENERTRRHWDFPHRTCSPGRLAQHSGHAGGRYFLAIRAGRVEKGPCVAFGSFVAPCQGAWCLQEQVSRTGRTGAIQEQHSPSLDCVLLPHARSRPLRLCRCVKIGSDPTVLRIAIFVSVRVRRLPALLSRRVHTRRLACF